MPLPVISSCDPIGLWESGKGFKEKEKLLRQTAVEAFLSDTDGWKKKKKNNFCLYRMKRPQSH